MKAVVLHAFGPAGNLSYESVEDPTPGPGQVRITVRAAGVHLIETMLRKGETLGPPVPELPTIFGNEVAGVVESVGPEVDPAWIGRRVVTSGASPGGYAELAVAAVAELHEVPGALGFDAAVAMIVTGVTTMGLLEIAELTADDVVLVLSAAGGIGRLLVQHALSLGATVVGAAGGPDKVAAVRELGAEAVDYNDPAWAEGLGGRRFTVMLEGVGGSRSRAAFDLLADGGRHIVYGNASGEEFGPDPEELKRRDLASVYAIPLLISRPGGRGELETRALAEAAAGTLVPAVRSFPLAEAAAAHAALESRATTGKVILNP